MKIDATLPPRLKEEPEIPSDERDLTLGLGHAIREIRKRRDMRQEELANRSNMGRASIATIETGRQNLNLAQLKALADALDMELTIKLEPRTQE